MDEDGVTLLQHLRPAPFRRKTEVQKVYETRRIESCREELSTLSDDPDSTIVHSLQLRTIHLNCSVLSR